jgi:N-acyl amino acid synthase of PEP-CTERM/exosortase system
MGSRTLIVERLGFFCASQHGHANMTTDSRSVLADFPQFFSIRPALSEADRGETYRIRYRVYCQEFGYEPADRFPSRMETDEFDEVSAHCLITHIASGQAAGCVRICPASLAGAPHPLPFDKCCARSLDPEAMARVDAPRDHLCEASRFAVDGAFRRRSGEALTRFGEINSLGLSDPERRTFPLLSVTLMLAGLAMAERLGRPQIFAVMEPFLPRLLKRSGLVFRRMGRDVDHHGIRAVYLTDHQEFQRGLTGEFETLYQWILAELRGI